MFTNTAKNLDFVHMPLTRFLSAQDRIGGVYDGTRISPALDEHSDAPLKHWQEHMKRKRERQQEQRRKEQEKNSPSTPTGSVDDYA